MKLDNKGFAITTIMYMILVMGVVLIVLILSMLSSRRLILEKTKHEALNNIKDLPSEYQEVEYIESSGSEYIDTGIVPNQNIGFEIVFLTKNLLSGSNSSYGSIMGARTSSKVNELQLTTYSNNTSGTLRFGTSSYDASIESNKKQKVTLYDKIYTNDSNVKTTLNNEFTSPCSMTIFALNQNGDVIQFGKMQLYKLKLYMDNIIVRNFIPCYRIEDNVIGLYDLVGNEFYTNKGSGAFKKGKNIY